MFIIKRHQNKVTWRPFNLSREVCHLIWQDLLKFHLIELHFFVTEICKQRFWWNRRGNEKKRADGLWGKERGVVAGETTPSRKQPNVSRLTTAPIKYFRQLPRRGTRVPRGIPPRFSKVFTATVRRSFLVRSPLVCCSTREHSRLPLLMS